MLKKNLTYSLFTNFSRVIFGFLLLFFLARLLSIEQFGVFMYSMVFTRLLVLVVDYGYEIKLSKDTAKDKKNISKLTSEAVVIKVFLTFLSFFILYIIKFTGYLDDGNFKVILILYFSFVFNSFANHFLIPLRSIDRFDIESKLVFFENSLLFSSSIIITFFFKDITLLAITFAFTKLLFLVISSSIFYKKYKFNYSRKGLLKKCKEGIPYAIHIAIGTIYLNIDTMILKRYVSDTEIGIYQAGMHALGAATILLTLLNTVLLPKLSSTLNNKQQFNKIVVVFNRFVFLWGLFTAIIITIFSKNLIKLVYSNKFLELDKYVWLFAIIIFLRYFGSIYGILLTISEKQKIRTIGVTLTLFFVFIVDLFIIPKYKIYGALYVLILAHILLNYIYIFYSYKEFKSLFFFKRNDI